jgi:hypothetical protein
VSQISNGSHCQVSILQFFQKIQNQYTLVPTQFHTISPNPFFPCPKNLELESLNKTLCSPWWPGDVGLIIYICCWHSVAIGSPPALTYFASSVNHPLSSSEAEFLDVIGTKVLRVFLLCYLQSPILADFTPLPPSPPPPSKIGLKLVCNVNKVHRNLKTENF